MWLILILVGLAMIVLCVLVEAAQVLIWLGVILAAVSVVLWIVRNASRAGKTDVPISATRGPRRILRGPLVV